MARPGKYDHLKRNAFQLWEAGGTPYAISQALDLPRTTLRGWIEQWKEGGGIPPVDGGETPETSQRQVSEFRQKTPPPSRKVVQLVPPVDVSLYKKACDFFEGMMTDPSQQGSVRVQAGQGLLKAIAMKATIPEDTLLEQASTSVAASVAEVEQKEDEAIAQDYREMLG